MSVVFKMDFQTSYTEMIRYLFEHIELFPSAAVCFMD